MIPLGAPLHNVIAAAKLCSLKNFSRRLFIQGIVGHRILEKDKPCMIFVKSVELLLCIQNLILALLEKGLNV
jgi:hypothetical protein